MTTYPLADKYFTEVPDIDWNDITAAHAITAPLLDRIAQDKALMRELVQNARSQPNIWSKCEEGVVEDKIVLWDEPDRGFRLRLRMSTKHQEEMPHQHRFSFTNYVLRGSFVHRNYVTTKPFGEGITPDDVKTLCIHEDKQAHCFTIHHATIHSTPLPVFGTINLVLRGPAVKDRAPVLFIENRGETAGGAAPTLEEPETARRGHLFYRVGEKDETPERRQERQMTDETYRVWVERFEQWGLI